MGGSLSSLWCLGNVSSRRVPEEPEKSNPQFFLSPEGCSGETALHLQVRLLDTREKIQAETVRRRHEFAKELFMGCATIISSHALDLVAKDKDAASIDRRANWKPCTGRFQAFHGLPCGHVIQERLPSEESLGPSDFDTHSLLQ